MVPGWSPDQKQNIQNRSNIFDKHMQRPSIMIQTHPTNIPQTSKKNVTIIKDVEQQGCDDNFMALEELKEKDHAYDPTDGKPGKNMEKTWKNMEKPHIQFCRTTSQLNMVAACCRPQVSMEGS